MTPYPAVAGMLCYAAAQSILVHPFCREGIYAASDPPPLTNFDRRRYIAGAPPRMGGFLLQFAVVPTIIGSRDADASARSHSAASAAAERRATAQRKLDGNLSGRAAASSDWSRSDAARPQLRRDAGRRQQKYSARPGRVERKTRSERAGHRGGRSDLRGAWIHGRAMGGRANNRQRRKQFPRRAGRSNL